MRSRSRPRLSRRAPLDAALAATLHAVRSDLFAALGDVSELQRGDAQVNPAALTRTLGHLTSLIDDLDWRRRLARGAIKMRPAKCDVQMVLSAIAVEMEAVDPDCVVVVRGVPGLPPASADPSRLRDVLTLVTRFALQRANSRPSSLELYATVKSRWIVVTCRAGFRLSQNEARSLFTPLELQSRSSLRFGPGLYVARALARELRGDLRVKGGADGEWALALTVPRFVHEEARCRTS